MLTKHFFKILVIFIGMILLGLVGVFLVSNVEVIDNESQIAK